ncbi:MAG: hypothetical protein H0X40_07140 [Chthoniobacterales bacterium]|nr:hypothetical protein [Chthoniobacterales bacterium]
MKTSLLILLPLFATFSVAEAAGGTDLSALVTPRVEHSATLLRDGRVLLAGGYKSVNGGGSIATADCEIYDPATNTWTATGSLSEARILPGQRLVSQWQSPLRRRSDDNDFSAHDDRYLRPGHGKLDSDHAAECGPCCT